MYILFGLMFCTFQVSHTWQSCIIESIAEFFTSPHLPHTAHLVQQTLLAPCRVIGTFLARGGLHVLALHLKLWWSCPR